MPWPSGKRRWRNVHPRQMRKWTALRVGSGSTNSVDSAPSTVGRFARIAVLREHPLSRRLLTSSGCCSTYSGSSPSGCNMSPALIRRSCGTSQTTSTTRPTRGRPRRSTSSDGLSCPRGTAEGFATSLVRSVSVAHMAGRLSHDCPMQARGLWPERRARRNFGKRYFGS
jgi:hypothetical protein